MKKPSQRWLSWLLWCSCDGGGVRWLVARPPLKLGVLDVVECVMEYSGVGGCSCGSHGDVFIWHIHSHSCGVSLVKLGIVGGRAFKVLVGFGSGVGDGMISDFMAKVNVTTTIGY